MNNFWQELDKPIHCLAPMEDVTDTVFREIVLSQANRGALDVVYTEFVNTDGMCHPIGRKNVIHRLQVNDSERVLLKEKNVKLVAQIWGANPEKYSETVKLICDEMEYDGIDINMGCPVPKIIKHGSCAKLITNPQLAAEIIQATKEASNLPVSVKTRIGYKEIATEEWLTHLLEQDIDALLVHGRTQKMMSEGRAKWDEIAKGVTIRDNLGKDTVIIGNGDVDSLADSNEKCEKYGLDGTMVGRAIFHNPWLFNPDKGEVPKTEQLQLLWDHTCLFDETWGRQKNFNQLKRFYKIYATGFAGAAALRNELLGSRGLDQVREILIREGLEFS